MLKIMFASTAQKLIRPVFHAILAKYIYILSTKRLLKTWILLASRLISIILFIRRLRASFKREDCQEISAVFPHRRHGSLSFENKSWFHYLKDLFFYHLLQTAALLHLDFFFDQSEAHFFSHITLEGAIEEVRGFKAI